MKRQIKFRAWDNEYKEMYLPGSRELYIELDGYCRTGAIKGDFTLMQFTGLLDMNGKEIYEGDILEDSERRYQLIFGELSLEEYEGVGWILKCIPESDENNFWLAPSDCEVIQIIGNIYENRDLILAL